MALCIISFCYVASSKEKSSVFFIQLAYSSESSQDLHTHIFKDKDDASIAG